MADSLPVSGSANFTGGALCASYPGSWATIRHDIVPCQPFVAGRYVVIQLQGSPGVPRILHLAEVRVSLAAINSVGCYKDSSSSPRLLGLLSQTVSSVVGCAGLAAGQGLAVFGLQSGSNCYGGADLAAAKSLGSDATACSTPCALGPANQSCGGSYRNSLYTLKLPKPESLQCGSAGSMSCIFNLLTMPPLDMGGSPISLVAKRNPSLNFLDEIQPSRLLKGFLKLVSTALCDLVFSGVNIKEGASGWLGKLVQTLPIDVSSLDPSESFKALPVNNSTLYLLAYIPPLGPMPTTTALAFNPCTTQYQ